MKCRLFYLLFCVSLLTACASTQDQKFQHAKVAFQTKHYCEALFEALPLAKNGNCEAQYVVGYMYYYGLGTTEDPQKAHYWISQSAQQGNSKAIAALENEMKPNGSL